MAGNISLDTACVFPAPRSTRVCYDPAIDADKPDDEVLVLSVGPPFRYNIPSFDLLAVELRQMKVKGYTPEGEEKHYDIFIRNLPSFTRVYPVWMAIRDATIVDVGEFSLCVKTDRLRLVPQGVLIVWVWEWLVNDTNCPDVSSSSEEDNSGRHYNPHMHTDTESESESEFVLPLLTHTVTFKCIGTTHHLDAQEALRKVSKLMQEGQEVPVRLIPEPDNQYDAKAISFKCCLDGNWIRIGYVVRDALDYVHAAISAKKIISVKFAWVKFMVEWVRCGPGFFAGINIALNGEWPREVCRCASTR